MPRGTITCLKSRKVLILAALCLGIAAWLPALVAWFAAEDIGQLFNVKGKPFGIFSWGEGIGFFRPLVSLYLWSQEILWGLNPKPFHLINVLLHLLNSWMVCKITGEWLRILPENHPLRTRPVPFMAALWFWIWPSHAEPVGWILGITDVLATVPGLLATWVYLVGRRLGKPGYFWGALALYIVALLCKECVFMLPGVILVYEAARYLVGEKQPPDRRAVLYVIGFGVAALLYLQLRYLASGAYVGGYGAVHKDFSFVNLKDKLAPNLAHLFLPLPGVPHDVKYWIFGICLGLLGLFFFLQFLRKFPGTRESLLIIFSLAIAALVAFLPGINLSTGAFMEGQRFSYFPSAFGIMASATLVAALVRSPRWLAAITWIAAVIFAGFLARFNEFRYVAGKVARITAREMKKLPPARRLYVMTTPGTYRDAFILPHGLLQIGQYMHPGFRPEVMPHCSFIAQWTPDTHIRVTPEGNGVYRIHLDYPETQRHQPFLLPMGGPYSAEYFATRTDGKDVLVTLRNFDPDRDRIAYADGQKWVMVH